MRPKGDTDKNGGERVTVAEKVSLAKRSTAMVFFLLKSVMYVAFTAVQKGMLN